MSAALLLERRPKLLERASAAVRTKTGLMATIRSASAPSQVAVNVVAAAAVVQEEATQMVTSTRTDTRLPSPWDLDHPLLLFLRATASFRLKANTAVTAIDRNH
jgi:hypothetical protein